MFIQMVLFSLNAIWIMIVDKDMKLMLFATGNLYRHTGTAMPFVKDETFTSSREKLQGLKMKHKEFLRVFYFLSYSYIQPEFGIVISIKYNFFPI